MQCEAAACTKSVNQEGIIGNSFFSYIVCTFSLCSKFLCICCCTDFCWKEENGIRIMENPFQYSMCKFQHVQLLFSSLQLRYLIFFLFIAQSSLIGSALNVDAFSLFSVNMGNNAYLQPKVFFRLAL